jgi:hypothetical protein
MAVRELSDGGPDGTRLGQTSTDTVGFFGKTPVVRYATSIADIISTAASNLTSQFGFVTSTQADQVVAAVRKLIAMSNGYGLSSSA